TPSPFPYTTLFRSYQLNPANQLILSYSEGFRVPTFADLYWPLFDGYQGNPDLTPEKSRSYELQWRSQLGERTELEASVYRTDFRDLIATRSEEHTSELQSRENLVCRLLLEKKNKLVCRSCLPY